MKLKPLPPFVVSAVPVLIQFIHDAGSCRRRKLNARWPHVAGGGGNSLEHVRWVANVTGNLVASLLVAADEDTPILDGVFNDFSTKI